jgi:uncharacterized membrane protein YgcG
VIRNNNNNNNNNNNENMVIYQIQKCKRGYLIGTPEYPCYFTQFNTIPMQSMKRKRKLDTRAINCYSMSISVTNIIILAAFLTHSKIGSGGCGGGGSGGGGGGSSSSSYIVRVLSKFKINNLIHK